MKKIFIYLVLMTTSLFSNESCPEVEILGCYENCLLFYRDGHMYVASKIEHFPYCKCGKTEVENFIEPIKKD